MISFIIVFLQPLDYYGSYLVKVVLDTMLISKNLLYIKRIHKYRVYPFKAYFFIMFACTYELFLHSRNSIIQKLERITFSTKWKDLRAQQIKDRLKREDSGFKTKFSFVLNIFSLL